ncbi:MAG: MMPL family transporter, partial [Acidobacteriia bacterium]|nr:MMPL family transporter [Terriglobia bacterium]
MRGYIERVLRYRWAVIALTVLITALAVSQARNLRIVIDPNTMLPQSHPYVATTLKVEKIFGSKYIVVIGVTPKSGDIYQPAVLGRIQRITAALMQTPGVVKENLLSLSARRAKDIAGNAEGMEVKPLMREVPQTPEQFAELKAALHRNTAYLNSIVSQDEKTATVVAEFRDTPGGFRRMMEDTNRIVDKERDPAVVEFAIGGMPSFLSRIEIYSERMAFLLPIAILLVGLILFEAFRTFQGMILPLVTAMLAVAWGVGTMGAAGIPMDAFNATTPILILAVSAGHAVQLLKRYYEEYYRILDGGVAPQEANRLAVVESVVRSGPVMIVAGLVAALGFFSLVVFEITTVRTFGIFTGIGIVAALVLEMTFIPALRSLIRPPGGKERRIEQRVRIWDRIEAAVAHGTLHHRPKIYFGVLVLALVGLFGMTLVVTNNSTKTYFSPDFPFQAEDRFLNEHIGGTNTLALLIEGKNDDAIKDPKVLQAMEDIQHFLEQQTLDGKPVVGKTVSMADFIKRMNQAMHGDDPAFYRIPDDGNLVSQYLLLYSMSGEPGDFDSYVDNDYRLANMTAYLKTDSSAFIETLLPKLKAFAKERLGDRAELNIGGSVPQATALNETMVHGKILNIVQIGAVVFIISSLVFRSVLAGLMVLLPLLLAVIANFAVMGYSGMYLNISNS